MKQISGPSVIPLSGCLLPWLTDRPLIVHIEGSHFIPIFSDEDRLVAAMLEADVTGYSIKQIDDAVVFIESVHEYGFKVALNPHRKDGKVQFHLCVGAADG